MILQESNSEKGQRGFFSPNDYRVEREGVFRAFTFLDCRQRGFDFSQREIA